MIDLSLSVHVCGKDQQLKADESMTKQFIAPSFPEDYASTLYCEYTVVAPEDTRIRFWINDFGTERFSSSRFYLWVSARSDVAYSSEIKSIFNSVYVMVQHT